MRESIHDLAVGESIEVGDRLLTVVALSETEVTLRIEQIPMADTGSGRGAGESWSDSLHENVFDRARSRPR